MEMGGNTETAVLAGGCAWTMQQLLRHPEGVISTRTGFMGGENDNPTEENNIGHAEVVDEIFYTNPEQRRVAEEMIRDVDASGHWPGKTVTSASPHSLGRTTNPRTPLFA
jgi:peptide-methionine (S)-S-oxide reductase